MWIRSRFVLSCALATVLVGSSAGCAGEDGPPAVSPNSVQDPNGGPAVTLTANASGTPEPEAIPVPGSRYVHGRSKTLVNAPITKVRDTIMDFGHYAEFMPHYQSSKVLGRAPNGS